MATREDIIKKRKKINYLIIFSLLAITSLLSIFLYESWEIIKLENVIVSMMLGLVGSCSIYKLARKVTKWNHDVDYRFSKSAYFFALLVFIFIGLNGSIVEYLLKNVYHPQDKVLKLLECEFYGFLVLVIYILWHRLHKCMNYNENDHEGNLVLVLLALGLTVVYSIMLDEQLYHQRNWGIFILMLLGFIGIWTFVILIAIVVAVVTSNVEFNLCVCGIIFGFGVVDSMIIMFHYYFRDSLSWIWFEVAGASLMFWFAFLNGVKEASDKGVEKSNSENSPLLSDERPTNVTVISLSENSGLNANAMPTIEPPPSYESIQNEINLTATLPTGVNVLGMTSPGLPGMHLPNYFDISHQNGASVSTTNEQGSATLNDSEGPPSYWNVVNSR